MTIIKDTKEIPLLSAKRSLFPPFSAKRSLIPLDSLPSACSPACHYRQVGRVLSLKHCRTSASGIIVHPSAKRSLFQKGAIICFILAISFFGSPNLHAQSAIEIIKKVDLNMASTNRVMTSKMTIHGRRNSRTVESKGYSVGATKSFTEYLSPDREKGTKMLKLENRLWIYSPDTDRTIQLSGHMLRQSVMGSDLSYEDMMEDRALLDIYNVELIGEEKIGDRNTFVIQLEAKVEDVSYNKQKMWVDTERFVPLKEEYYAKSGQLLKVTELSDVIQIQGRWFPRKILFQDILKKGKGTEFEVVEIIFNTDIPDHIFSKAVLKK